MRLYLIRHATAEDAAASDAKRELTKLGNEESRITGAALARLKVHPDAVLSSPLVRARQTATLVARELKFEKSITIIDELANEATTAQLIRALKRYDKANDVLVVGHMPSLADHLAKLIGAHGAAGVGLGKGSVACIEIDSLREGGGSLHWFMRQKQLRLVCE